MFNRRDIVAVQVGLARCKIPAIVASGIGAAGNEDGGSDLRADRRRGDRRRDPRVSPRQAAALATDDGVTPGSPSSSSATIPPARSMIPHQAEHAPSGIASRRLKLRRHHPAGVSTIAALTPTIPSDGFWCRCRCAASRLDAVTEAVDRQRDVDGSTRQCGHLTAAGRR